MSALPPKADILQRSKIKHYTITSSEMESKPEGTSIPSACAV